MSFSEIYLVRHLLEEHGIFCFTKDELLAQTAPYLTAYSNGIQLQVEEKDIIEAVSILQEHGYLAPKIEKRFNETKVVAILFAVLIILMVVYLWRKGLL
ncbi:hypothetical protein A9P82_03655 [Arachidicoccus ginsenosidimutans]|nr:hypothetical protein A9P82_03655 [Arachidicoccus sp. BS20]